MNGRTIIIINALLAQLMQREPTFPWFKAIHNTYMRDANLEEYLTGVVDLTKHQEDPFLKLANLLDTNQREIIVYVRTDYNALEFQPKDPTDQVTNPEVDFWIFIEDYTFFIIID